MQWRYFFKRWFLPRTDTLAERKRFAVFHACTLIISPILGALVIILSRQTNSTNLFLILFSNLRDWLLCSLFTWNFIGFTRFHDDAFKNSDSWFVYRFVAIFSFIFFPLIYLHNLWCILMKKYAEVPTSSKSGEGGSEKP